MGDQVAEARRWERWALFRQPNYILFFTGLLYVALCVAIVVLGHGILEEKKDALNANVGSMLTAASASAIIPCGLPTPDLLLLRRALGRRSAGF